MPPHYCMTSMRSCHWYSKEVNFLFFCFLFFLFSIQNFSIQNSLMRSHFESVSSLFIKFQFSNIFFCCSDLAENGYCEYSFQFTDNVCIFIELLYWNNLSFLVCCTSLESWDAETFVYDCIHRKFILKVPCKVKHLESIINLQL